MSIDGSSQRLVDRRELEDEPVARLWSFQRHRFHRLSIHTQRLRPCRGIAGPSDPVTGGQQLDEKPCRRIARDQLERHQHFVHRPCPASGLSRVVGVAVADGTGLLDVEVVVSQPADRVVHRREAESVVVFGPSGASRPAALAAGWAEVVVVDCDAKASLLCERFSAKSTVGIDVAVDNLDRFARKPGHSFDERGGGLAGTSKHHGFEAFHVREDPGQLVDQQLVALVSRHVRDVDLGPTAVDAGGDGRLVRRPVDVGASSKLESALGADDSLVVAQQVWSHRTG